MLLGSPIPEYGARKQIPFAPRANLFQKEGHRLGTTRRTNQVSEEHGGFAQKVAPLRNSGGSRGL